MERLRLRNIELTGGRAAARNFAFLLVALAAAITGIGYLLPAHRVGSALDFHSNAADGGPVPFLVAAFVIGAQLVLRRYRLGAGIAAGVISAAGAIGAVAPVLLAHLLQTIERTYGDDVFAVGVIGMFFTGIALLLVEPVLYVLERRRIVRETMPAPLPVAVAVMQG